jgi:hypothetical protein
MYCASLAEKFPKAVAKPTLALKEKSALDCTNELKGVRIRHTLNGNSLKRYYKEGSILRVETTIVRPRDFRVYRAKEGQPNGPKSWRILRKGISDMYRRAEV